MSAPKTKTIAISLPPQMVDALDRVRKGEHRIRSELLRAALRRYTTIAERSYTIPVEDALPAEIEAMRRANEEYARGQWLRLEDFQHQLGLRTC
jgi:Arc/MetJ-type ribon-helix-helix transcriptional regulator